MARSSPSNTRAVPSKVSWSMPATLTTAPLGASEPVSTAIPPWAWMGSSIRWTTSPSGAGGSRAARFSATVRPVTVRQSPCSSPASSSSRITTGTPPMRSMSAMWYLPWGLVSARCGTRAATLLKSSSSSSTRASWAMAKRWSTALVEPPRAMVTAMAFSKASLVIIWRGRIPARRSSTTAWPEREGGVVPPAVDGREPRSSPGRAMPRASATEAMVLAVNMPAHDPSVGQALCSMRLSSSSVSASTAWAPTASNTEVMSSARSRTRPGRIEPP